MISRRTPYLLLALAAGLVLVYLLSRYRGLVLLGLPSLIIVAALFAVYLFPAPAIVSSVPLLFLQDSVPFLGLVGRLPMIISAVWVIGLVQGRWRFTPAHVRLLAFAGTLMISYVFSPDGHDVGPFASGFFGMLQGVGLACAALSVRLRITSIVVAIGITSVAASLFVVTGGFGGSGVVEYDFGAYTRVIAFGLNSNSLGTISAVAVAAVVGLALDKRRQLLLVGAIPSILILPDLKSRSSIGLILVGVLVAVVIRIGLRKVVAVIAAIVVFFMFTGSTLAPLYQQALGARANSDLSSTDSYRAAVIPLALELGFSHPLVGIGDGNFQRYASDSPEIGIALNTHNEFTRLLAEFGLPALIAFIVVLVPALRKSFRFDRTRSSFPILVVLVCSLLISNQIGNLKIYGGFWILLGGVLALRPRKTDTPQSVNAGSVETV